MLKAAALTALDAYRKWIRPFMPSACRFYPSCADYAYQAIERRGVATGFVLATSRLLRCHPLHDGGFDPVPESHR